MPPAQTLRRPEGVKVTYRRMRFGFEDGFARYWHGGSPFISLFWTQLSTAFEPGERFFIDAARAFKDLVEDDALLDEVAEFCKQEGHHTFQHLKFDRVNAAMGIDIEGCRARYAYVLARVRDKADPMQMLAVTMALEHFTAGFAEQYLGREEVRRGAQPAVEALWRWHAAEETEHKATCYDLYRALQGSYRLRVGVLFVAWSLIIGISLRNTYALLRDDGKLGDVRDVFGGLWYLFGHRGLISRMLPSFLAYFHPRFHPWKQDNAALIAQWRAESSHYIAG
jgi:predicted metal-dependent hydrolase